MLSDAVKSKLLEYGWSFNEAASPLNQWKYDVGVGKVLGQLDDVWLEDVERAKSEVNEVNL